MGHWQEVLNDEVSIGIRSLVRKLSPGNLNDFSKAKNNFFFRIPSPIKGAETKESTREASRARPAIAHHSTTVLQLHSRGALPGAPRRETGKFQQQKRSPSGSASTS